MARHRMRGGGRILSGVALLLAVVAIVSFIIYFMRLGADKPDNTFLYVGVGCLLGGIVFTIVDSSLSPPALSPV